MRYKPLGQSGIEASVVAFGAWAIGGWMWGGTDEAAAIAAIDTAPGYGLGLSERLVGRAIAGRRDQVVIATKCGLLWDADLGDATTLPPGRELHRSLAPDSIRSECAASLERLGTDYIDLYQTHWQDDATPIADTMGALLDLKQQGKIRAIGVSNASVEQMEQYRAVGSLDSDQERYSMLDRGIERSQLPYCRERGIAVLAYSPLSKGLLTGKIGPGREFAGDDLRRNSPRFSIENRRRIAAMLDQFKPIAQRHHLTIGQLAIAWTAAQPGLTHVLVGARNPQQARENAGAGDAALGADELSQMEAIIAQHAGGM
jgi:aryl-alcohol dehydrogenase-like predicted oxidoreductase